ncbi:MAG: YIP1 family protein [candidate division Zixibacteria bacterium]|nr:YIP1 family protein [candidate division Zixibacteria bacterium]
MESNSDKKDLSEEMNAISKITTIFWEPRRVFNSINLKPTWLIPWILLAVIATTTSQLTREITFNENIEKIKNLPGMTEEQFEQFNESMGEPGEWNISRVLSIGTVPILILIIFIVSAGALYFTGSVIGGGNSSFKHMLSVYSHAALVGVPGAIVGYFLINLKGTIDVGLSPTLFLPMEMSENLIYKFLGHFDFFTVWTFILVSIGYSVIYKFSSAKSFLSVGALWLVWIVIAEVFQNIFGGFIGM